jgi:hypothetical protein
MIIPALLVGGCLAALLVWYMRRPNFTRLRLSAARFLPRPPPPRSPRTRWTPKAPLLSSLFYLRATILGLLAAACLLLVSVSVGEERAFRLAVVVDVSDSMGAGDGGNDPTTQVSEVLRALANHLSASADDAAVCVVLREVGASVHNVLTPTIKALRSYEPTVRAEGAHVTSLLAAARIGGEVCDPQQVLVLTDQPAPADPSAGLGERVIWLDLSRPADNVGFVALRGQAVGFDRRLRPVVEIAQFGKAPLQLRVEITGDTTSIPVDVSQPGPWHVVIPAPEGPARLTLAPGGAYEGDDRLAFEALAAVPLQVDWQIEALPMPRLPGWEAYSTDSEKPPGLLVAPLPLGEPKNEGPAVFVYPGLSDSVSGDEERRIGLFVEGSGLLEAVNFDLLEDRMRPLPSQPPGFSPIIQDDRGIIVVAVRADPRTILIPGPSRSLDENGQRLWMTLLFNSLRWALNNGEDAAHAKFTDAAGIEIPNAALESDTAEPVRSVGTIEDIQPVMGAEREGQFWLWLVAAAALLLAVERLIGVGWRERAQ